MKVPSATRKTPAKDDQVDEMLADPAAYFTRVRDEARREAREYVANRERKTTVA